MYPPSAPATHVPFEQAKDSEIPDAPMIGPQDFAPIVLAPKKPMEEKEDTIVIDNVEISMVAIDKDLDKFEEAFVSTKEVEILCAHESPKQQDEVQIEDLTRKEEEKEDEPIDEPSIKILVQVKSEVMDNTLLTPKPSISLLSSLTIDTTSLDSWGEEDLMKISVSAMEKAKEKQVMRNPLFVESVTILNNLLPEEKKVIKVHSMDDVSKILSSFKENLSSLEEETSKIAEEKYLKKRPNDLIGNFSLDLNSLKVGQASLKEISTKGRMIIANYMNKDKLTLELSKKIQQAKLVMEVGRKLVEDPSKDINMCRNVYQGQIDKIENTQKEIAKIRARQAQLRHALALSLDVLNQNIKEIDATIVTYNQGPYTKFEKMENLTYALCAHRQTVDALKAFWQQEIQILKIAYPDVFIM